MQKIPILMYHHIADPLPGDSLRKLYVSPRRFRWQMRLLSALGFRGLSMSAAIPYFTGQRRGRVVVLTFDDGYRDTLEQALPVLRSHRFTATCYLVSRHLGRINRWDALVSKRGTWLMDRVQILSWIAAGMEVGGHTRTHLSLTRCTDRRLVSEVAGCKTDLEAELDTEIAHFAYPYGDWDPRVREIVRQAGFRSAVTTAGRRARPGDDLWQLPRVNVKSGYSLTHFFFRLLCDGQAR